MGGLKKLIKILVVVALAIGYLQWPRRSVRNFEEALKGSDPEKLKAMIDANAFAKSVISEMEEVMVVAAKGQPGAPSEDQIRSRLRRELEKVSSVNFEKHVDAMVKGMLRTSQLERKSEGSLEDSLQWEGPFTVSVGQENSDSRILFGFRGTGWKLSGVKMGKGDLSKVTAMMGQR